MASQMINFRLSEELTKALDLAARQQGLNRSDYIRQVLKTSIGVGGTNGAAPVAPREECPHPAELLRMTTYGIKVCQCGAKIR